MKQTVVKYGLRHIKSNKLLRFTTESNHGRDFCFETSTRLDTYGDHEWLVDKAYIASYVKKFSTEWYNATYETPQHGYEPEDLEVVKVETTTDIEPVNMEVPTVEEYLTIKYGPDAKYADEPHLSYLLGQLKSGTALKYSLYELQELILEGTLKL